MKTTPVVLLGLLLCVFLAVLEAAAQDPPPAQNPGSAQGAGSPQTSGRGGERRPGVFGKLTAVHDQSVEITKQDGTVVTVKISGSTQFRKEREAAKLSDL